MKRFTRRTTLGIIFVLSIPCFGLTRQVGDIDVMAGDWVWSQVCHVVNQPPVIYMDPSRTDLKSLKFSGYDTITLVLSLTRNHRFSFSQSSGQGHGLNKAKT